MIWIMRTIAIMGRGMGFWIRGVMGMKLGLGFVGASSRGLKSDLFSASTRGFHCQKSEPGGCHVFEL
jgi:hypothetical protein